MDTSTRRRGRRQQARLWRVPVRRVRSLTPRMVRITVGGDELADFPATGTDQNVMLYFYDDDVELPEPLTLEAARGMWSRVRPTMRSYTISGHDPAAGEIDFDFVLHDAGPASAWAAAAEPGDQLIFVGPSPNYTPDPDADWYLLAGDETAIPAIAATLRELPAGKRALVFVEVTDVTDEQPLPTAADAEVRWLHRGATAAGQSDVLVEAVRAAEFPDGQADAWIGTERSALVAVRQYLLGELGMPRANVRATTYWRHGEAGN
ncbi:siderophore-interacting protein [Labedaea rhizosphaerae]|uniref:siderophore-interacting protein n=1 Tax=Labedaea rhizosphaerae TaxID=598644 RepID=UPI00105CC008|nr:siderophore-interacting protein [Labedaea rhizosphaerae]